jgi:hypothetical protein
MIRTGRRDDDRQRIIYMRRLNRLPIKAVLASQAEGALFDSENLARHT